MVAHLFGATSSPSIANFALRNTADRAESQFGTCVADTIRKNFYVDDCLKAVQSEDEAIQLIHNLRIACKQGGFRITKFCSNRPSVLNSIPSEECSKDIQTRSLDYDDLPSGRALGVHWSLVHDSYGFSINMKTKPSTRRGILSTMSSIYDPLGFVAPFILYAKKILQDLCREQQLDWDDPVPEEYSVCWNDWLDELPQLEDVQVNRCIKPLAYGDVVSCQLHVFSDASTMGYGAVTYLRLLDNHGKIHCTFIMGKARLAPVKLATIPRLELTAATVAVRIGHIIQRELEIKLDRVIYHTDSTTVLHYIFNEKKRFPIFVANRVQFIRDHSNTNQWYYVDTNDNPADYASRGMTVHQITRNKYWLGGPAFLWKPETSWPNQPILSKDYYPDGDCITSAVTTTDESITTILNLIHYYSDWFRLKKAVAIYRKVFQLLYHHRQSTTTLPSDLSISVTDITDAENAILRFVQSQFFQREIDVLGKAANPVQNNGTPRIPKSSSIYKLDPFLSNGLLRVGGRLSKSTLPDYMKFPVLLPHKSHVTTLVIQSIHEKLAHSGRNHVLAHVRERFWVIHSNAAVRRVISKCVICRRLQTPPMEQKMSDLPAERSRIDPPFSYTGVDFFGPYSIKRGRTTVKRYGAIFTCLASRAVHIEIAASLDTDSFINALRRFLARRGPICQLRCDNGTNFVGAERELREALAEMNESSVKDMLMKQSIEWVFNPPAASHMGGIWERQIRTVRKVLASLSREFGDKLDDESLQTLMCEVESIINSRPLTTVSSDPKDADPLTPNHLLTMKSTVTLPPPGHFQRADVYQRKRWRRIQHLANLFWSRWRKEFLLTLQQRQKWNQPRRNMHVGDLVYIKDDMLPRNNWSMGRISATEPDNKGFVRSVIVKTARSELRRPVDRLVLLIPIEIFYFIHTLYCCRYI